MAVIEALEEALHEFMTTRIRLLEVGNLIEGIGKVASSTSCDFHLGKYLRVLLEDGDVGVRLLLLGSNGCKESCCTPTNDGNV